MIEECVLHLAGSRSPRGSGWGVLLRTKSGAIVARAAGGEADATSYQMELVALLRGLASVPAGTARLCIRLANLTLLSCCDSYARTGALPRKVRHPDLLRQLRPLLAPFETTWTDTSRAERDAWDKEAKTLAQRSAVAGAIGDEAAKPLSTRRDEAPPATEPAARGRVIAFTDGGCRRKTGIGGWAFLLVDTRTQAALERSGGERTTTNNRMEMTAAIRALEALKREGEQVEVRSDSQYLVNMCRRWIRSWKTNGWRRRDEGEIQNLDLVRRLDELMARHVVRWTWVRGHAGVPGNEHVDRLASAATDLVACGRDPEAEKRYGPGLSPLREPVARREAEPRLSLLPS